MVDQVDCVVDAKAVVGEGAIWDQRAGKLYWVDILGKKVFSFDPVTQQNDAYSVGEPVGTVVPKRSGGVVVAVGRSIATLDFATGDLSHHATLESAEGGARFNDGKCDPAGRLWVGMITGDVREGSGALFRLDRDLTVHRVLDGVTLSNGLVWSLDGNTLYYIDSMTYRIDAFTYDGESGTISERRQAVELGRDHGIPDGMTIDEEGLLWVAHWGTGRVCRWDPQSGQLAGHIELPVRQTASCAFGGEDLSVLYITTARYKLVPGELERQPLAGGLFSAHPGVRGVPSAPFDA